jgi:hypothetical protein
MNIYKVIYTGDISNPDYKILIQNISKSQRHIKQHSQTEWLISRYDELQQVKSCLSQGLRDISNITIKKIYKITTTVSGYSKLH